MRKVLWSHGAGLVLLAAFVFAKMQIGEFETSQDYLRAFSAGARPGARASRSWSTSSGPSVHGVRSRRPRAVPRAGDELAPRGAGPGTAGAARGARSARPLPLALARFATGERATHRQDGRARCAPDQARDGAVAMQMRVVMSHVLPPLHGKAEVRPLDCGQHRERRHGDGHARGDLEQRPTVRQRRRGRGRAGDVLCSVRSLCSLASAVDA